MAVIELTKQNFDETISTNDMIVVDFWAEWCGPCKSFAPVFEEVSQQFSDIVFAKVNIEVEQELAADFNVRSIPLLMVMRQNIVVFSQAGTLPASALTDLVNQAKGLDMDKVRQDIESQQS